MFSRCLPLLVLLPLVGCSRASCPPQPAPWYTQGYETPRFGQPVYGDVVNQPSLMGRASYLELRTHGVLVGRAGWRCAGAKDPQDCGRIYDHFVWPRVGPALLVEPAPSGPLALLEGAPKIREWLGPVDGLQAAALHAVVSGYEVHEDATGEAEGDHWLLLVYGEPPERRPTVIRVARDGATTEVASSVDQR